MLLVLIVTTAIYIGLVAAGLRRSFQIHDRLLYLPALVARYAAGDLPTQRTASWCRNEF